MYEVEQNYGNKASLAANKIAENMFSQVNVEENRYVIFQAIVNHRYKRTEVKEQDALITTHTEMKHRRETMKGVEVLIQWNYGSMTRVALKDTKK